MNNATNKRIGNPWRLMAIAVGAVLVFCLDTTVSALNPVEVNPNNCAGGPGPYPEGQPGPNCQVQTPACTPAKAWATGWQTYCCRDENNGCINVQIRPQCCQYIDLYGWAWGAFRALPPDMSRTCDFQGHPPACF